MYLVSLKTIVKYKIFTFGSSNRTKLQSSYSSSFHCCHRRTERRRPLRLVSNQCAPLPLFRLLLWSVFPKSSGKITDKQVAQTGVIVFHHHINSPCLDLDTGLHVTPFHFLKLRQHLSLHRIACELQYVGLTTDTVTFWLISAVQFVSSSIASTLKLVVVSNAPVLRPTSEE